MNEREVQDWSRRNGIRYVRTSVKENVNVSESYAIISEAIYRRPVMEKAKSITLRRRDVREVKIKQKKCC